MKIISTSVLVNADVLQDAYNENYSCSDNCLDACTCTGNCD